MYIQKTLLKFNEDKSYKFFPGTSIINQSFPESLNNLIIKVKKRLEKGKQSDKYIFLPEDSYHMTICNLLTYNDLKTNPTYENFKLKNETNIPIIDKYVSDQFNEEIFALNVTMIVDRISARKIHLKPKTEKDMKKLTQFRLSAVDKLSLKLEEDYQFHISLSYQLLELSEVEKQELDDFLLEVNQEFVPMFSDITIDIGTLVAFNDMSEFRELSKGRKNLGQVK